MQGQSPALGHQSRQPDNVQAEDVSAEMSSENVAIPKMPSDNDLPADMPSTFMSSTCPAYTEAETSSNTSSEVEEPASALHSEILQVGPEGAFMVERQLSSRSKADRASTFADEEEIFRPDGRCGCITSTCSVGPFSLTADASAHSGSSTLRQGKPLGTSHTVHVQLFQNHVLCLCKSPPPPPKCMPY
jgi:hypothetical protein